MSQAGTEEVRTVRMVLTFYISRIKMKLVWSEIWYYCGMTNPINTGSIAAATTKSWEQWVKEIDAAGGRSMTHTQLAKMINTELSGKIESHGWWAQGITVAYEQHVGKRVPGQLANGLFEIAVSKSVPFARSVVFNKLENLLAGRTEFNTHKPSNQRISQTPKRSNWRCDFADGSKFAATIEGSESAKIVLSHTAIPTKKDADDWKEYWKTLQAEFIKSL